MLEILLLLHQTPLRNWTAPDVARELRIDPLWAAAQLELLYARGLAERAGISPHLYRFRPQTQSLDETVDTLAQAYADRRVSVISLIYAKPPDALRSFADAFRLRKDKLDG